MRNLAINDGLAGGGSAVDRGDSFFLRVEYWCLLREDDTSGSNELGVDMAGSDAGDAVSGDAGEDENGVVAADEIMGCDADELR